MCRLPVVEYLLESGANRSAQKHPAVPSMPVVSATLGGHHAVIMCLLAAEAGCPDPTIGLFYSASLGYLPGCERFLAAGAEIDTICMLDDATPLAAAAQAGHLLVVNRLLQ